MPTIPIEVSARHIHVSRGDLETLFGKGYRLTPIKDLSQHGQFACKEVVEIQTKDTWGLPPHFDFTFGKSCDHNQIRILGPEREHTQVELSWFDFINLGIDPVVCLSGEYEKTTGGVILIGPKGEVKLDKGVMVAKRHIHCSTKNANKRNLHHGQIVSVKVVDDGSGNLDLVRSITFHNVVVRVHDTFDWQMHIDTDEANAAGIKIRGIGKILL